MGEGEGGGKGRRRVLDKRKRRRGWVVEMLILLSRSFMHAFLKQVFKMLSSWRIYPTSELFLL